MRGSILVNPPVSLSAYKALLVSLVGITLFEQVWFCLAAFGHVSVFPWFPDGCL